MGDLPTLPPQKSLQNILIIGNQYLSRAIINGLLNLPDSAFRIILLTYPGQTPYLPLSADASRIQHGISDFTQRALEQAFEDQDLVISTVAPGDASLQTRIIDACIAAGVRGFIPNEFGLDSRDALVQDRLPAYKARAGTIEYLRTRQDELQWVGISVGVILDHELLNGKFGFDLKWHSASLPGSAAATFAASSLQRVGHIVGTVIRKWNEVKNSYLVLPGCTCSVEDVSRCLETETKADWVIEFTDVEDVVRSGQKMLESGWPDAGWMLLQRTVIFQPHERGDLDHGIDRDVMKKLGLEEEERIADIVHSAVHEWNHSEKGDCGCN